ncbi:MAG: hypothetical protein J1E28_01255 [Helicobacter sp.]|uniref:hypothetical protein n=1 Tax=Helicobacter sp. TaxID=218 RepID=UPI0025B966A4|nr:hypothetical protein [Helicobacter sp.]MCH5313014.1 hypothetical protein [Helicobacter sp.]MCH5336818.1 hypothetical protein [Campylobacter sp.]
MQEKIEELIIKHLRESAEDYDVLELKNTNAQTKLYTGLGGVLDSLALVSLVSDLEELLSKELGKEIILADEKMMSARNSPFKDVKTLAEYITKALEKD